MKGDFQAVRKELGPQLKELQSFVQKDGPEAVNRLLSKVKSTKPRRLEEDRATTQQKRIREKSEFTHTHTNTHTHAIVIL